MASSTFSLVRKVPLSREDVQTDISLDSAKPETFRFVYIPALLDDNTLEIRSATIIPEGEYACVSYVWDDLKAEQQDPYILVSGLGIKDSLSIRMLKTVCRAAKIYGCNYLWIDKLGIRQDQGVTSEDKRWQMGHMYDVYAKCKVCIVAPGGLVRLPSIDERTKWIDRAWTLQEALAPQDVRVLFKWHHGSVKLLSSIAEYLIEGVEEDVGICSLRDLLIANYRGEMDAIPTHGSRGDKPVLTTKVELFMKGNDLPYGIEGLLGAMEESEEDAKLSAVWWCLVMRQARYEEDMIYSSMGVMGAVISGDMIKNGIDFNDDQVTKLLLLLMQKLTEKARSAGWLSMAPYLGGARGHSGLPALPLDVNLGPGFVKSPTGNYTTVLPRLKVGGDNDWWWLRDAPFASINDNGDITFNAKACSVEELIHNPSLENSDRPTQSAEVLINFSMPWSWKIQPESAQNGNLAIWVGTRQAYSSEIFPPRVIPNPALIMLAQIIDIKQRRYQAVGYSWTTPDVVVGWKETQITIGG